jgi:hypothetical protein
LIRANRGANIFRDEKSVMRTCFFVLSVALPISASVAAIMFGMGSFVLGISIKFAILQFVVVVGLWAVSGLLLLWARSKGK